MSTPTSFKLVCSGACSVGVAKWPVAETSWARVFLERVRAKVLAFVRSMMDARTIYQAGGGDVDMDNDDEDDV